MHRYILSAVISSPNTGLTTSILQLYTLLFWSCHVWGSPDVFAEDVHLWKKYQACFFFCHYRSDAESLPRYSSGKANFFC